MGRELISVRIIIITKSISIIINSVKYLAHAADLQPDISETLEGTVNIEKLAAAVGENQFINGSLNPETVRPSLG